MKHVKSSILAFIPALFLLAAALIVPLAARAQQTTPTAQAQPSQATPALPAQPGQVKKEEAEDENVFRHTPLVASISDMIFRDNPRPANPAQAELRERHIETTARGFEWINFLIIALAIGIPLAKFMPRVLRKRSQTLQHELETARKTTADANSRLSAVEAQLAHLDDEIVRIRTQMEEESRQDEARIKASIEEESTRIVAAAEQEIGAAAAHAQRGLRHFAADLAIEQAARQIILTPETDRALIAEFVREAGDGAPGQGKRGGQN